MCVCVCVCLCALNKIPSPWVYMSLCVPVCMCPHQNPCSWVCVCVCICAFVCTLSRIPFPRVWVCARVCLCALSRTSSLQFVCARVSLCVSSAERWLAQALVPFQSPRGSGKQTNMAPSGGVQGLSETRVAAGQPDAGTSRPRSRGRRPGMKQDGPSLLLQPSLLAPVTEKGTKRPGGPGQQGQPAHKHEALTTAGGQAITAPSKFGLNS